MKILGSFTPHPGVAMTNVPEQIISAFHDYFQGRNNRDWLNDQIIIILLGLDYGYTMEDLSSLLEDISTWPYRYENLNRYDYDDWPSSYCP